jgi:hypothetical protein
MKWSRDHVLTCSYMTSTVVLDRRNVIFDRLNVISSGIVAYMKIDAKVCLQGDHLVAIFEVPFRLKFGTNVDLDSFYHNVRIF